MNDTTDEIVLEHTELAYMLDQLGATALIGVPRAELFPADPAERRRRLREGEDSLLRRGLLLAGANGLHVLDISVTALVNAVAYADVTTMLVRSLAGLGSQLFLLYQSGEIVVEHTLPREGVHRLELLPSHISATDRLMELLPVTSGMREPTRYEIAQDAFFEVRRQVISHQYAVAETTLRASGFPQQQLDMLLAALSRPDLSGNIAFLRRNRDEITDARNLLLVKHDGVTWAIRQRRPGETVLSIEAITPGYVRMELQRYREELAVPA